jgi:integrase
MTFRYTFKGLSIPHQAVELVAGIIDAKPYSPWLFPVKRFAGSPKNPYMQPPKTMLERIFKETPGDNVTPHSLLRTAATQLEELGFTEKTMVSRILNHTPQDITSKHYLGGTGLEQMKKVLQKWADYLDRLKAGREDRVIDINQLRRLAG